MDDDYRAKLPPLNIPAFPATAAGYLFGCCWMGVALWARVNTTCSVLMLHFCPRGQQMTLRPWQMTSRLRSGCTTVSGEPLLERTLLLIVDVQQMTQPCFLMVFGETERVVGEVCTVLAPSAADRRSFHGCRTTESTGAPTTACNHIVQCQS